MRIGYGYDVHNLVPGRKLILGGIEIPFIKGLLGHSDADVLMHAIIDAILGAMAWGDIGSWFPDEDVAYKDINSRFLLEKVMHKLKEAGWTIGNLDCTVCAYQPKLRPFIESMRANLATELGANIANISIKATTEEGLGVSGVGEGMSATAVVLLKSIGD
jgi:2-C-methyl-D-erythritol 2,4-cyclodiphosphate synthase